MRVSSARHLAPFVVDVVASTRQVRRSPGFLCGRLMTEPAKAFSTLTVWGDEASVVHWHRHRSARDQC